MLRTFNCGIGGIVVVDKADTAEVLKILSIDGGRVIGEVVNKDDGK